jgi:hypothetical protein
VTESTTISVKFECKKCGGQRLSLPDDPTDDSIASCAGCGNELGRWGDLREAAKEKVRDEVRKSLKKMVKDRFNGSRYVKVK